MMMAGKFQIGDVVEVAGQKAAIFYPGQSRWYALRVAPQREDQVEAWLGIRGVYGFHPVLARKARRNGVVREYHRRYLPGYVFARFEGDPIEHAVMACPWVLGALCRSDGEWGVLEPKRLQAIHSMRKLDEAQKKARAASLARRQADARIRAGDSAMFRAGPFAGFPCEVVELLADGGAIVRVMIFGRETSAIVDADEFVPVRKAG